MAKRSKRYTGNKEKVAKGKVFTLPEALALVKQLATAKFDETVEVHVRVGIDPTKGEEQIRSTVSLPHGTGKSKKVAAFVDTNFEKDAREAGADFVYMDEDIAKIKQTEKIDFDVAIATPAMMPKLAAIAKILGPKGLMPNPKTETVTTKVADTIKALKKGKITFKNDNTSNVHMIIGKVSFPTEQLQENFVAFIDALKRSKPSTSKGIFIQGATLTSSMGPGVPVEVA